MSILLTRHGKGYRADFRLSHDDLTEQLPLEAEAARVDMPDSFRDFGYYVSGSELYAKCVNKGSKDIHYWFDTSVRQWHEINADEVRK